MAALDTPINNISELAANYKPGSTELVAPGWQPLKIIKSEKIANSDNDGSQFVLEIQAKNGLSFKKWICCQRFNPEKEWQAENGRAELATIAIACQHKGTLTDSSQLHGKWFMGNVLIKDSKKLDSSGNPYKNNDLKEYKIMSSEDSQPQSGSTPSPW